MTPRDLALEALSFITAAPAGTPVLISSAKPQMLRRIASDLTAALQLIYSQAPSIYRGRIGMVLDAPRTITVNVTNKSTAISTEDDYPEGATIRIEGDDVLNEVASDTLMLPYSGGTGTKAATVWSDSFVLPSSVSRVDGSVLINERRLLNPKRSRAALVAGRQAGAEGGEPRFYWVEPFFTGGPAANQKTSLRLRLFPMPSHSGTVGMEVRYKAPKITPADFGNDEEDPNTPLLVPEDYIESVVRPIFLINWSNGPWYRREEGNHKSLEGDAQKAMAILQSYELQQDSGVMRIIPYG